MKLSEIRSLFLAKTPLNDSLLLLSKVSGISKTELLAKNGIILDAQQMSQLKVAIEQYKRGIPLPYILGEWEFYGLPFYVTPDVLIPRPETEMIIDQVLSWVEKTRPVELTIIDIGTGSGIIPISLAKKLSNANIWATDISDKALELAYNNAKRHGVEKQVHFVQADLFEEENVNQINFNVLTANLPYIPTSTLHQLEVFGREPTLALDGGEDGLDLLKKLILQIANHQPPIKLILLEMEHRQGKTLGQLAEAAFSQAQVSVIKDLSGQDRLLKIENYC